MTQYPGDPNCPDVINAMDHNAIIVYMKTRARIRSKNWRFSNSLMNMNKTIKRIGFVSIVFFVFALDVSAQAASETANVGKKPTYDQLLAKLKSGDTNIDYGALRMTYTETKSYSATGSDPAARSQMSKAVSGREFTEAIKVAKSILDKNYVDINAHVAMAVANRELGDTKLFEFHKAVYRGLIDSIVASGDGKTAKTAYVVISVPEEYALLQALDLRRGSQSLLNENGHTYDVLTVTDPKTNESRKIYFNIDIVWSGYDKMFKQ